MASKKKDPDPNPNPNPEDQGEDLDVTGKKVKKATPYLKLASRVMDAFRPIQYFLAAIGRFPLAAKRNKEDGTYNFRMSYALPNGYLFLITTALMTALFGTMLFNLFYIIFGPFKLDPRKPEHLKLEVLGQIEKGLIHRHIVFVIFILCNCFNAIWGAFNYLFKRKLIRHYFSYWTRIIQRQLLDIAGGMWFWSMSRLIVYWGVLAAVVICWIWPLGFSTRGITQSLSLLCFKILTPNMFDFDPCNYLTHQLPTYVEWLYNPGCGILILLIMVWSKSFIIIFLFQVQLVEKTIGVWNGRAYASILRAGQHTWTKVGRNAHRILFKDHCVIMDLLEGSDRFYGSVVEGFLLVHIVSLITEVYFAVTYAMLNGTIKDSYRKEFAHQWKFFVRPYDSFLYCILAAHNVYFIYLIIKYGAHVTEEGMAALEIIRQKSMLGRRTDEEIYFKWSIYYSLTSCRGVVMELGGYLEFSRDFMIAVLSTYSAYFIILQQFRPYIDYVPGKWEKPPIDIFRIIMGRFIKILEPKQLPCHWIGLKAADKDDICDKYEQLTNESSWEYGFGCLIGSSNATNLSTASTTTQTYLI